MPRPVPSSGAQHGGGRPGHCFLSQLHIALLTYLHIALLTYLLDKLPPQGLRLCHRVVDGLCGRETPHRGDYSATWSLEEWLDLLSSLTEFFRMAVGNNCSDEEAVLNVLRARQDEIRRALLDRTTSISSSTLQDFDWQLKLAVSSDKISSLHTPLLSLSLDVRENGALQPVTVEINREELNTLISSLEAANKVVLQLK
uniref:COMM domain-containing protein n=1 Tax=Monopterus albus TaxID=43700 RepID=A0A3Q3J3Y3_MONAL